MEKRPAVPLSVKRELIEEAGGKCANPGCPASAVHIHHIQEWHVYQAHDSEHMIAICPNCHDAVHRGTLRIDDEALYRWKNIPRSQGIGERRVLFVEPGPPPRLLLGSITVRGDAGIVVFDLGPSNRLGFAVEDGNVQLVALVVTSLQEEEVVRILDNRVVSMPVPGVTFEHVSGRVVLTSPMNDRFIPWWALQQLREVEPSFPGWDGRLRLADVEVLDAGLVRVQGVWAEPRKALVITASGLHFCRQGMGRPITLVGEGIDTVLQYEGPITTALFNFE